MSEITFWISEMPKIVTQKAFGFFGALRAYNFLNRPERFSLYVLETSKCIPFDITT